MNPPSFGVELHEYLDAGTVLQEAQLAERRGYASVWLGDSQLIWRDLYVLMGAVAASTVRVNLGTGVTNPVTRLPAVTASAMVTLQELSRSRGILGVGVGDSSVRTMGREPVSRAELARWVHTVRELCQGGTVHGPNGEMRLTFGAQEKCPPIVVGASGPKMLKLAGQVADGVIITRQAQPSETLRAMLRCVQEGRQESGRQDRWFMICLSAAVAVHRDRSKAMDAVRPHVARGLLSPMWSMSDAVRQAHEQVKASYNYYEHMNPAAHHSSVVPDEAVREYAIAGTPDDCIQQVRSLFELGIDEITIRPYGVDGAPRSRTIELFAREVMEPALERTG